MTVVRFEVAIVSPDGAALADFYTEVFGGERLEPMGAGVGKVHRVQFPGALLKVMQPKRAPAALPETETFLDLQGVRYLTIGVDDFDAALARATERGATVQLGPMELAPGIQLVVLQDPEGNTVELLNT